MTTGLSWFISRTNVNIEWWGDWDACWRGFHSAARGGTMRNRSISCSAETPGARLEKGSEWNGKTIATVQKIFFFPFFTTHWVWKSEFSTFVPLVLLNLYFAYCKFDDLWAAFGTTAVFTICWTQGVAVARACSCQALWQCKIKDIHLISVRWSINLFPAPQHLNQLVLNSTHVKYRTMTHTLTANVRLT